MTENDTAYPEPETPGDAVPEAAAHSSEEPSSSVTPVPEPSAPEAPTAEPSAPAPKPSAAAPLSAKRVLTTVVTANSVTVTVLAILLAMIVGAVLMVVSDTAVLDQYKYFFQHPTDALGASWDLISSGYTAMFKGAVFDVHNPGLRPIETTIVYATPLVFSGLAVAVPFRAGLFNIGGNGQLIAGATAAAYVGFTWSMPTPVHVVAVILAGMAGGAVYAGIVGVLKARTGAHEVITTIMLNYIAVNLLLWLISTQAFHDPARHDAISKPARPTAILPHLSGASPQVTLATLLAIAAIVAVWWLMSRSTLGFRLRAVGSNPEAARTAGIRVPRTQTVAMLIAGALMGLVGVSQVLGTLTASHALTPNIDASLGFTGITVALLGRGRAWGVALAALLFGAMNAGGVVMEASVSIPHDVVTVIQALIVVFVAAPALVREIFRLRAAGALSSVAPAGAVIGAGEAA